MAREIHARMHRIPNGTTPVMELRRAMERIETLGGVRYPPGYGEDITARYTRENVPYPYIIMQIAQARIKKHFHYGELLKAPGDILDYGCGTGDAIRQLIRDGYPPDKISGFDVSDASLCIGYDLFMDRHDMEPRVMVAPSYPCAPEKFDYVYSGSVIHVLGRDEDFTEYLDKSFRTLKPGGTFFGSTLGLEDSAMQRPEQGPPRLMRKIELLAAMERAGFSGIRIEIEERPEMNMRRPGFCLYQFRAGKVIR